LEQDSEDFNEVQDGFGAGLKGFVELSDFKNGKYNNRKEKETAEFSQRIYSFHCGKCIWLLSH
jgi:hypothetical protein